MASSDRVELSFLRQDSKGTIPSSPFKAVRHTGGTFGMPRETIRSDEIRGDAQRGAAVETGRNPEATVNLELSAETFDELIRGLMRSDWSTAADASGTDVQANEAESRFESAADIDWTTESITEGQWVYVAGFENEAVNGWYKVTSIGADNLGVSPAPPTDDNTESNTITFKGAYIRNGTDTPYYALQLEHKDLTDKHRLISDARVGQMQITASARSRITGSIEFQGRTHELRDTLAGDGTVDEAPDTEVMNTGVHVPYIYVEGEKFDGQVMEFGLTANMNPRRQNAVGEIESADIALGALDTSGTIQVYLSDSAWDEMLKKYIDYDKIRVALPVVDGAGKGYVFEFPKVALTNEPGNLPGPNQDVMLNLSWEGEPGDIGGEDKTLQISKVT